MVKLFSALFKSKLILDIPILLLLLYKYERIKINKLLTFLYGTKLVGTEYIISLSVIS